MNLTKPRLTTHTGNTLIMKDYHLFLSTHSSYISEIHVTKSFFDVACHDKQRAPYIFQIHGPIQVLDTVKFI